MHRSRSLVAIATAVTVLAAAPVAGAADPEGFAATFPKAAALCAKADKGKLGKKLSPSKAKVKGACKTLRTTYGSALATLTATRTPLQAQTREIVLAQRNACREARKVRTKGSDPRQVCRQGAIDARNRLAPVRAQIAAATAKAQSAYEQARKAFWATIKKLKGGAGIAPDAKPGGAPVTDVPADTELDEG